MTAVLQLFKQRRAGRSTSAPPGGRTMPPSVDSTQAALDDRRQLSLQTTLPPCDEAMDETCGSSGVGSVWSTTAPTIHSLATPPTTPPTSRGGPSHAMTMTAPSTSSTARPYDRLVDDSRHDSATWPASQPQDIYLVDVLELRAEYLLSTAHLQTLLRTDSSRSNFTRFLQSYRPNDLPVLQHYLTAKRALDQIKAANALIATLPSSFTYGLDPASVPSLANPALEDSAAQALTILLQESLPAYVAHSFHTTNAAAHRRVVRALGAGTSSASDGLAQMFCVTDPGQPGNPIIFASKEFCRLAQQPLGGVLNRAADFLHGPMTDGLAIERVARAVAARTPHAEVMVCYRRDGTPLLALQTVTPLRDTRGQLRYWLRSYIDCSAFVNEPSSAERATTTSWPLPDDTAVPPPVPPKDSDSSSSSRLHKARSFYKVFTASTVGLEDSLPPLPAPASESTRSTFMAEDALLRVMASASDIRSVGRDARSLGVYHRYLIVRPRAPFRILFASPALQLPQMIQSPFMAHVGGDRRVRAHLAHAMAAGRKVTAKIAWLATAHEDGAGVGPLCWAHCTPLCGEQGEVGVWVVLLLDEGDEERGGDAEEVVEGENEG